MNNTVDHTRTATDHGMETGSVDNSVSQSTLNPYAEEKVMYGIISLQEYMEQRNFYADAGIGVEKSTLLDDTQGVYSDTMTGIYLELQIQIKYEFNLQLY